jgi:predicted DNA-binding protein with PD1-like motif
LDEIDVLPHHYVKDDEECKERNIDEQLETSSLLGNIRHRNSNSDSHVIL